MTPGVSTPDRRAILRWSFGLSAFAARPSVAQPAAYPSRTVHLVVGFAPGGAGDLLARILATHLSERLGETVIVENKSGAGGILATHAVVNLPADGHTILLMGSSSLVSALILERTQPDLLRDIEPIVSLTRTPFVIAVNSAAKETTLADFISHAKADPGGIRVGIYGFGTQSHFAAYSFCKRADIEVTLVPYRGSAPMMNDLLGNYLDAVFDSTVSALPHIRSRALRALAVTSAEPMQRMLPTIPPVSELFAGYEVVSWTGLAVRKGTLASIVECLHREGTAVLNAPTVAGRLADMAFDIMSLSRNDFLVFWADEIERTRALIRDAGISLEYTLSK